MNMILGWAFKNTLSGSIRVRFLNVYVMRKCHLKTLSKIDKLEIGVRTKLLKTVLKFNN